MNKPSQYCSPLRSLVHDDFRQACNTYGATAATVLFVGAQLDETLHHMGASLEQLQPVQRVQPVKVTTNV